MISSINGLIQTPGICNGIQTENCMKQISYTQFFDFIETLNRDLKKLRPLYEEDPQHIDGNLSDERLNSLLETFDSSLDLFMNILNADSLSTSKRSESSIVSPIFATMLTNYMQMTAELFSHEFPNNAVLPFIGIYANLQKVYIDILRCAQTGISLEDGNVNISRFKSVWNNHYSIFSDLPNLIKSLDFPGFSQKLENIYQYTKNFNPDDNTQQQALMMINNLSYLIKSMKEKLLIINEKISKNQIQDLFNEASTFQEYVQSIGQNQLNGLHMTILYSLVTNLGLANSILNISEYLEKMNKIIQQEDFAFDVADFATQDVQLTTVKHIMQTMISEFNCLIRFSHKPQPISIKRIAQSLYQAIKNESIELNDKYERLVEIISPLTLQSDIEYENVFISTMSNIRSPETIFESFKNTMKKIPKTLEDHSSRLSSFIKFENAAHLNLNESNDIIKFKEYLFHNIISVKIQEIIPILEDQISRVEGNLAQLNNASKMIQISSYCQTIILHLHQMMARKKISNKARLFTKIFTLFMEFIDMIIKRGFDHHSFIQLVQNLAFPTPELIKRELRGSSEISNLRLLISKIQMCQLSITKTASVIFDKFTINKGNEENYVQFDQSNGQYIQDKQDIFSRQIGIFDRCDEYIKQLFLLLYNYKVFSNFFSIYSKFYEIIGQSPSSFKISQRQSSEVSPVLVKNIPIFIRSLINLLKKDKNREPFLSINSSLFDLYSTVLSFLKSTYLNENADHSVLFLHVLDSIPILNFSRSLSEFFSNLNRIEVVLLSSRSVENLKDSIKDYRDCTSSIIKSIIIDNDFDVDEMNGKIDRFLAGLFYISPQIFSEVEEIFSSVVCFLKQLGSLKSFIDSLSLLTAEFNLSTQTFNIKYKDIILRNFVLACSKVIKKINKAEFLSFEVTDYLSSFVSTLSNSLPKRLFERITDFYFVSVFQAFMNLYTSSVSFYQSSLFPLSISSFLPPPPPVSFSPNMFSLPHFTPQQSPPVSSSASTSNLTPNMSFLDLIADQSQSILSLPCLPLPSLWFMNNFDFIQKVQPLLTSLTSIVAIADENSENMKILIKMNEIVRNFDFLFVQGGTVSMDGIENINEDEKPSFKTNEETSLKETSNFDCSNLYLSKFSLAYKLKKMLKKLNFDSQISQCQFIECYTSLESLIDTEIRILHLNRLLMLTNYLLYDRMQSNIQLIKSFKFTKCSKLNESIQTSPKEVKKINLSGSKTASNEEYDDYDESEKTDETAEAVDYEEEQEETETGEPKQEEEIEKEKVKEIESENLKENENKEDKEINENKDEKPENDNDDDEAEYEEDHEDDAENRKEEEDQEYGEDHEYGEYDYDDYSEIRMKSAISNNFRRGSIGGLNDGGVESIFYSNKVKNRTFFEYNFARKVNLDFKFINPRYNFNNSSTKNSRFKKDSMINIGNVEREMDSVSDNSNEADFFNDSFNSFPFFDSNSNGNAEFGFDRPVRFQLHEIIENSDAMMAETRKFIESSSHWMQGLSHDVMIPLIPFSEAVSEVNRELHSTVDSIYQKISTFDKSDGEIINIAKKLMEKSATKQNDICEKQKELFAKKREFARSKNVLSYTYALAIKKYEKLKSENLKKRYELQQLNSRLKISQLLNSFDNLEDNESGDLSFESKSNESSASFLDENENDESFQSESDFEMKNETLNSTVSVPSDSIESSQKSSQSIQNLVVEPFVPVRIVANIGMTPSDTDEANRVLNEELLKNERLKGLLRASNEFLRNQRKQNNKILSSENDKKIILDSTENDKKDVIDRYFGQIALVKSFSENLDKPISSEVDVDQAGEELVKAVSDFRKNSTESRQAYHESSKNLLRKLDRMISIYRVQKDRTNKVRGLIRAAKVAKEDYKTALSKILDDEKF